MSTKDFRKIFPKGERNTLVLEIEGLKAIVRRQRRTWILFNSLAHLKQTEEGAEGWAKMGLLFALHENMRDWLFNSVAKLLDPSMTAGKENLSLNTLLESLDGHVDAATIANVRKKINDLDAIFAPVKEWRNKWMSHSDYLLAITQNPEKMPSITLDAFEEGIEIIEEIMNLVIDAIEVAPIGAIEEGFEAEVGELISRFEGG